MIMVAKIQKKIKYVVYNFGSKKKKEGKKKRIFG
jgi:hypothetical protein